MKLPANLPSISKARLPATYEKAKNALAKCSKVDECATWAKKAEALASYAKQAGDKTLRIMADRIQARAIRRCGELLKQITPAKGGDRGGPMGGRLPVGQTRTKAARQAGLSDDQRKTALRVANLPDAEFEAAVESENPPTVTELAERGKTPRALLDLGKRDPAEVILATQAQGHLERLAKFAFETDPRIVVRGSFSKEYPTIKEQAIEVMKWCGALADYIREAMNETG